MAAQEFIIHCIFESVKLDEIALLFGRENIGVH